MLKNFILLIVLCITFRDFITLVSIIITEWLVS